jgi:hypothetical protein
MKNLSLWLVVGACTLGACGPAADREAAPEPDLVRLSSEDYSDRVYASWLGQMIGNIYGLPHENVYIDEPRPDELSEFAYRGWPLDRMREVDGAFSDDDTDIEYMYLLQMEKHGIEPTYAQLRDAWTHHVRDRIWLANRAALTAMHAGFLPPVTGSREYNPHWFQIDPQLVNEIWAVTAPGMVDYAAEKSAWAARITNDSWGIEPTVHYAAMYAAAFFEGDVNRLIDIGLDALPEGSRFAETITEVRAIHDHHRDPADWRAARAEVADRYYVDEPIATRTIFNANLNGAMAILALLYGDGDFRVTLDMSCALGFDADNQAATMAGLLGIVHGTAGLPEELLLPIEGWEKPFNDTYRNVSRHDLPDATLTGMARLMVEMGEKVIVAGGGQVVEEEGSRQYLINRNAAFTPPLELAPFPHLVLEVGQPVDHAVAASLPAGQLSWRADGPALPDGLAFEDGSLRGTPREAGEFRLAVHASRGEEEQTGVLSVTVFPPNLAPEATEIVASVPKADVERRDAMWVTVARNLLAEDVSVIGDGRWKGDRSVFYSVSGARGPREDFYGYRWEDPRSIGHLVFRTGTREENGGWFTSLRAEHLDDAGEWAEVEGLEIQPGFDTTNRELNKAHYTQYRLGFEPVRTKGIRLIGEAGGGFHWHEASNGIHYTSITELAVYPPLN